MRTYITQYRTAESCLKGLEVVVRYSGETFNPPKISLPDTTSPALSLSLLARVYLSSWYYNNTHRGYAG